MLYMGPNISSVLWHWELSTEPPKVICLTACFRRLSFVIVCFFFMEFCDRVFEFRSAGRSGGLPEAVHVGALRPIRVVLLCLNSG